MEIRQRLAKLLACYSLYADKRIIEARITVGQLAIGKTFSEFLVCVKTDVQMSDYERELIELSTTTKEILQLLNPDGASLVPLLDVEGDPIYRILSATAVDQAINLKLSSLLLDLIIRVFVIPLDEVLLVKLEDTLDLTSNSIKNSAELATALFSSINSDNEQVQIAACDIARDVAYLLDKQTPRFMASLQYDQLLAESTCDIETPYQLHAVKTQETIELKLTVEITDELDELDIPVLQFVDDLDM